MYASIKKWCNVTVQRIPFIKRDGAGDKKFDEAVNMLVYPVSEVKVVKNKLGVETTSNTQLYVDGDTTISEYDEVIFEGTQREIIAIVTFYRDGVPDIKVVYL